MATRQTPDDSVIRRWNEDGLTRQQMADRWFDESGIRLLPATFSMRLNRMGNVESKVPRYDELIPWNPVLNRHQHDGLLQMLRYVARRRLNDPKLSPEWAEKARKFEEALIRDGLVIAYKPRTVAGFHKVQREPQDTDIIRQPTSTGGPKVVRTHVVKPTKRERRTGG